LAITPPSATALIDNLAKEGYVARSADKSDRRAVYLTLTKKGQTVMQKAVCDRCKIFKKLLGKINSKQQLELLNILTKLTN
jgi:MarR family 2-MHQ and catechol resistance regulon transcriptional repressor